MLMLYSAEIYTEKTKRNQNYSEFYMEFLCESNWIDNNLYRRYFAHMQRIIDAKRAKYYETNKLKQAIRILMESLRWMLSNCMSNTISSLQCLPTHLSLSEKFTHLNFLLDNTMYDALTTASTLWHLENKLSFRDKITSNKKKWSCFSIAEEDNKTGITPVRDERQIH